MDHDALIEVVQALVQVPSVFDPATGRSEDGAARRDAALRFLSGALH